MGRRPVAPESEAIRQLVKWAAADYRGTCEAFGEANLMDFLAGYYALAQRFDEAAYLESMRNEFEKIVWKKFA